MISLRGLALSCFVLALTSCNTKDISEDQECWGNFKRDFVYTARVNIYLVEREADSYKGLVAIPDANIKLPTRRFSPPTSMDDPSIKTVITPGEKLKAERITLTSGWNFFVGSYEVINVFAKIGHEEVLITELATRAPKDSDPCGQILAPNPILIQ